VSRRAAPAVEFDRYGLRIRGARRLVRAGSLHYFRLPAPELWRDRLQKMRAAGLNAVDVYYPWNYHSEAPGEYDFSGLRDVDALHDMIEELGLWLIARPGPYVCAELDLGGLPAWLLEEPAVVRRCRTPAGFLWSRAYMERVREWFSRIVPRFAQRPNLILVQAENEYQAPGPLAALDSDFVDLLVRWLGSATTFRLLRRFAPGGLAAERRALRRGEAVGQTNGYMRDLCALLREFGVTVPIFHNDLSSVFRRQLDVDLLAVDRYPITSFERDWRDDPGAFDGFSVDEAGLDAHRRSNPLFYPELQGGWYDGWGGSGYARVRERLGPDGIDAVTKWALAERATLWNYYMFAGGTTWGYLASPDVYSSYDYGAPIDEQGGLDERYEAVARLNDFLDAFEEELCRTERVPLRRPWCPEHFRTRQGATRRFVFLRNPSREARRLPTPEEERSVLEPWEHQIRVYDRAGRLDGVSPLVPRPRPRMRQLPPPLPRLERFTLSEASPQLDPAYDDSAWAEIPPDAVERNRLDIDALGLHYGFVWYRGVVHGPLDRLILDARHCWSAWLDGRFLGSGDALQNVHGVGPDGARPRRVSLRRAQQQEGRNSLVILVESLGHNKDFADDGANPRGLVRIDVGSARVDWRYRGGLLRGERGIAPVVAFEGVERAHTEEVVLPYGWGGEPSGVALFETRFRLDGVDPKSVAVSLAFDPGRGKANLYLNGHLLGRYWPERGPQRSFALPWGVLRPRDENHLAVALWKRDARAALGKLRLEVVQAES
jgi:hypothetical protein